MFRLPRLSQRAHNHKQPHVPASPPKILAMGFVAFIVLGAVLLKLPGATTTPISWFEAIFAATSAVTVTGLSIFDVAHGLTAWGKVVIILLVQIGGLGFVTFTVLAATTLGRRITLGQQALAMEAFNQTNVNTLQQTALAVIKYTITIQLIAFVLLSFWWSYTGESSGYPIFRALFHVSMAFNNAGFMLFAPESTIFRQDAVAVLITTLAIIIGGIGFPVLQDLFNQRRWSRFSVYTKVVLIATLVMNIAGFLILWGVEASNPLTLKELPWWQQGLAAWLQAVSSRTAGFKAFDVEHMRNASIMLLVFYMLVGGGSFSTASGIKINTLIVLLVAVRAYLRQQANIVLMHRSISASTVQKALALVFVTIMWVVLGIFLIALFDDMPFRSILFEVVAAISTTGMGDGITAQLSWPSQTLILLYMYIGRLGPLTIVYVLATRRSSRIAYPETHFQVG